jgi:SAM-dependent methyltransferase
MSDGPIFIVGTPRSGTTMLQAALRLHEKVWGGPESHFLLPLLERHAELWEYAYREPADEFLLPSLGITEERFLEYLGRGMRDLFDDHAGGRRWVDHTPSYVHVIGPLATMFPDARFLLLVRDGRQVAASTMRCWWGKDYTLEQAAQMWASHVRSGLRHLDSAVADRILSVRYERLITDTDAEVRRIEAFVGLDHEPAMVDFIREGDPVFSSFPGERSSDKLRPRWSGWDSADLAAFDTEAGDLLVTLGYEPDRSWAGVHASTVVPPPEEGAAVLTTDRRFDRITEIAEAGDPDLAVIEAARLVASWYGYGGRRPAFPQALSHVMSDLAVLRFSADDRLSAKAFLAAAVRVDPHNALAAENLEAVEAAIAEAGVVLGTDADLYAKVDNLSHWVVEALDNAERLVGLSSADVLEVGGSIPEAAAVATGATRWASCDLIATEQRSGMYEVHAADVGALPFDDESFDVVFSSCAFEHFPDMDRALAECHRVLRPGGALFSQWAPIWSHACGHHLWTTDDDGGRISFSDPVIPAWGHLLLTEAELEAYLAVTFGAATAKRAATFVHHYDGINRLFEGDFQRVFDRSGFEREVVEPWGSTYVPSPRLADELACLHPGGGDFSTYGFRAVLRKPGAATR